MVRAMSSFVLEEKKLRVGGLEGRGQEGAPPHVSVGIREECVQTRYSTDTAWMIGARPLDN